MTLNVALTGNVAAGKSAVLERFAALGAAVISADEIVRTLQQPGTEVVRQMVARFGSGILDGTGHLDRAALRNRVMNDPDERRDLEAIIHPAVSEERRRLFAEAADRGAAAVISEIPLLFEADDPESFDLIVLVDAAEEIRLARMVERRGMTTDEARAVIAAQLPADEKRGRSHYLIENDGTPEKLIERVDEVWQALTE